MNCPVCKDSKLSIADRLGVEIDYCPNCRGVWLDRGELDKIVEKSIQTEVSNRPIRNDGIRNDGIRNDGIRTYDNDNRYYKEGEHHYGKDDDHHGKVEYDHNYGYKKKRRGGFLGDLFDF